jgi:hypothetical protein
MADAPAAVLAPADGLADGLPAEHPANVATTVTPARIAATTGSCCRPGRGIRPRPAVRILVDRECRIPSPATSRSLLQAPKRLPLVATRESARRRPGGYTGQNGRRCRDCQDRAHGGPGSRTAMSAIITADPGTVPGSPCRHSGHTAPAGRAAPELRPPHRQAGTPHKQTGQPRRLLPPPNNRVTASLPDPDARNPHSLDNTDRFIPIRPHWGWPVLDERPRTGPPQPPAGRGHSTDGGGPAPTAGRGHSTDGRKCRWVKAIWIHGSRAVLGGNPSMVRGRLR